MVCLFDDSNDSLGGPDSNSDTFINVADVYDTQAKCECRFCGNQVFLSELDPHENLCEQQTADRRLKTLVDQQKNRNIFQVHQACGKQ